MKEGELLLNWQKKPVGIYLGDNKVFWFKDQVQDELSSKQMLALFYQEGGLEGANLEGVSLRYANLEGANLSGAELFCTNLDGADLRGANLTYAKLRGVNLRGAKLDGADLRGAYLRDAYLRDAKLFRVKHNENTIWPVDFNKSRLFS